jgi:hypothetical protein
MNFYQYRSNITPTLHEAKIKLYHFSGKKKQFIDDTECRPY